MKRIVVLATETVCAEIGLTVSDEQYEKIKSGEPIENVVTDIDSIAYEKLEDEDGVIPEYELEDEETQEA